MNLVCKCGNAKKDQPYDKTQCRLCWLYLNDPAYEALFANRNKVPAPPENVPGIIQKAITYTAAMAKWMAAGKPVRDPFEVAKVYDTVCSVCPRFQTSVMPNIGSCGLCGCRIARQGPAELNKLAMATEHCPDLNPKW